MHLLTKNKDMVLRIDLKDSENRLYFAKYKFVTQVYFKFKKFINTLLFKKKYVQTRTIIIQMFKIATNKLRKLQ